MRFYIEETYLIGIDEKMSMFLMNLFRIVPYIDSFGSF